MSHRQIIDNIVKVSGCGSVWLEYLVWDQGVAGSNPVTPIKLKALPEEAFLRGIRAFFNRGDPHPDDRAFIIGVTITPISRFVEHADLGTLIIWVIVIWSKT